METRGLAGRTTLEWAIWQYPDAKLTTDRAFVDLLGKPRQVLWRGLDVSDADFERPTPINRTVGDAFDDFRLLAVLPESDRADHLLKHVQTFGISLLCKHGLPLWHRIPETEGGDGQCVWDLGEADPMIGLEVERAAQIAEFFDDLLDLCVRIEKRQRVSATLVRSVLRFPFHMAPDELVQEVVSHGDLKLPVMKRWLATQAMEQFMENAGVRNGISWVARRRPELVLKALDSWSALAIEAARRMSTADERVATHYCSVCGLPVLLSRRPRDGDRIYCKDPECQRERWRRNKARQRTEGDAR